ncbi:MAG: hydantoinase B/oxoprolinase family protein [Planctomycetes bacterium]|nr:hydantoinase B/oxoprolinase family protein [Planctomycetota bacterium]
MGVLLARSAFSANIKERRDFSCGIFDAGGRLAAQAAHIPVHLGSMPLSVRAVLEGIELGPGDVAILNDPFCGGTHLPDLTMVAPVFVGGRRRFLVANRAHHADVGGARPGSMALARSIHEEGLRIPPVLLVRRGKPEAGLLETILANVRTPGEREGDLAAQRASLAAGERRLLSLAARYGPAVLSRAAAALMDYSERMLRHALSAIPAGTYEAEDSMDDDGFSADPVPIRLRLAIRGGEAVADFTRSALQAAGGINANRAVTLSALLYAFRCLLPPEVPANDGLLRPLRLVTVPGTVVDAAYPAAVAGGNVETSQRIVDVLFAALAKAVPGRIPAASAGTMSNLSLGGFDRSGAAFSHYETIPGGAGAGPGRPGVSALQTHMTNTRNTPVEALEHAFPLRVTAYSLRSGSGGSGARRGGDGVRREIEVLLPCRVSLFADRARRGPPGLDGGGSGAPARFFVVRKGRVERVGSKVSLDLAPGERIRVLTPGGGGHGRGGGEDSDLKSRHRKRKQGREPGR